MPLLAQQDSDDLATNTTAVSRVLPAPNTTVNYRLAGFSVPANRKAVKYLFEVVQDSVVKESAFNTAPTIKETSTKNRAVILLPEWGANYTWRVSYIDAKNKITGSTPLYRFKTGGSKMVDTSKYRMHIISQAKHHAEVYPLVDFVMAMYDMDGVPLWYLPEIGKETERGQQMRDLKATPDGTFTAMTATGAHEFDYSGNILWSAPDDGKISGDTTEHYHHEFTKLRNGHYMVCGQQYLWRKVPGNNRDLYVMKNDPRVKKRADSLYYKEVMCGTLIEYDKEGKIVWSWKSSEYLTDNDFFRLTSQGGFPFHSSTHLNAFDFDETNKLIYISFRDINKVMVIEYPSGKIYQQYGEKVAGDGSVGFSPFYGQHCCRVDRKTNNLFIYNNNFRGMKRGLLDDRGKNMFKVVSHIMMFKQPVGYKDSIQTLWDFTCDIDSFAQSGAGSGGSITLLDDNCLLVAMGAASRMFIVSPEKKIIWNALPQVADGSGGWMPLGEYRASYLKKNDIEKYIFYNLLNK